MRRLAIALIFALVGFSLLVIEMRSRAADESALLTSCRGGNLRSAYELANHSDGRARTRLARDVLPIIDCERLVEDAERVAVDPSVQREYVRLVVEERLWPVLEDGQIADTQALPGR